MFVRLASLLFLILAIFPGQAASEENRSAPFGKWITAKGESHIEIFPCGGSACGRVAWMKDGGLDDRGKPLTDVNNPNPAMHRVPVLGLVIMTELQPTKSNARWAGKVYNPRDGRTYDIKMTVQSESEMIIEGCGLYGLICQKQEWERVEQ